MELVAAEKHQQEALKVAQERNKTLSMLDEILEDVRKAADRLEEEIEDHVFDNNKQVSHRPLSALLLQLRFQFEKFTPSFRLLAPPPSLFLPHRPSFNQMKGVNVEAVLRVEEDEEDNKRKNVSWQVAEGDLGLSMLIDSQNNQYVLTKPRDSTIPRADHHFIKVSLNSAQQHIIL